MPFDAEEAELLSATQSLCRWTPGVGDTSSGSVSALPTTVDSLRSVELFLRRDHPTLQPHHRSVGRWQTVQTALLPLMTTYKRDREVMYPVMKLLVRLTMPLPADSDADSRRERAAHQRQIRSAMLEGAHLDVLMQWLTPLLARPPAVRSVDDVNLIELSLTLVKNTLAIAAGSNTQPNAAEDGGDSSKAEAMQSSRGRQVGERIIRRYAECGVLDVVAAVCWQPEDLSKFGLLLLETVALLVGGVGVDELLAEQDRVERESAVKRLEERNTVAGRQAAHGVASQFSYLWKGHTHPSNHSSTAASPSLSLSTSSSSSLSRQLQTVRLNEKSRVAAPSRQSRFGTLLTLPSPLSTSLTAADLSSPPLSSGTQLVRNMFDMHAMGSENLPSFRGRTPRQANSAASASLSSAAGERGVCSELVDFVVQFVSDGCFEKLMDSVVTELKANVRVVRDDEKNWMAVAALMMGMWRQQQANSVLRHNQQHNSNNDDGGSNKENIPEPDNRDGPDGCSRVSTAPPAPHFRCEPVMACLSSTAFSLLTSKLLLYIQEKPSPLPYLCASLQLYSESVHTLSCMLRTASPEDRERANQLRHAFYYEKEQLDLLVSLMRQWNAHTWGGSLMALLVECVHWSMQMLDDVDGTHTVSQRKKRRVVKNKTVLVDGSKQKMAIAELQQALPANVLLDAHMHDQRQQQLQQPDEQQSGDQEQQHDAPIMAVVMTKLAQPSFIAALPQTGVQSSKAAQQEATQSRADVQSEQGQQQDEPALHGEAQSDTVVAGEREAIGLLTTFSPVIDSVDTQAVTLPLQADSLDSTADTIYTPNSDIPEAAGTAEAAASVDSNAVTQEMLPIDPQEAATAVDSQALTVAMADDASGDSLDLVATQLLPADELLHVDNASECDLHASDTQDDDRHLARLPVSSSVVDVSDASLSTLVSEMAIQPLDVVLDSMAPDDTDIATDRAEYIEQQRSTEQLSAATQWSLPAGRGDDTVSDGRTDDHDTSTTTDSSNPSPPPTDDLSDSTHDREQHAKLSLDHVPAADDERPLVAVISAVTADADAASPVIATVVSAPEAITVAPSSLTPDGLTDAVSSEEQDVSEDEEGYFRMEATFNFSAYLLSYANPTVLSHYLTLLAAYRTNSTSLNAHIMHFLSRIAFDRQLLPMLFQLSFLQLCDTILNDQLLKQHKHDPQWRPLTSFCKKVVRGFFDWVAGEERGEMMFVECLFWKTVNSVELMRGAYRGGDDDNREGDGDDDNGARQDEEMWQAEVQAQVDGDWQPGGEKDDSKKGAVKKSKGKGARRKKKDETAVVAHDVEADDGEIDIAQLMNQQARKDKERQKREKKEQRRRDAEAKEREKDRQRRALMAVEDDDEEELQLEEYDVHEAEEKRRREQKARDEAAEAEGAEKEWRADEEELLRAEYPLFTALKSRYALMSSRLHSRFTKEEVRRKIKQLGLEKASPEPTANAATPASPAAAQQPQAETDMHTATTDEEQSEVDSGEITAEISSPRADSAISDTAVSLALRSARPSSISPPSARGPLPPNGSVVDVKGLTGSLYDQVSDMTRYAHHRTFIQLVIQTLTSCAQQRREHSADWKQFTAAKVSPDTEATAANERAANRQRQLLSLLQLVRVAGGAWSVQRQYTAEKLEAVVATMERAYGNAMDDCFVDGSLQQDGQVEEEGAVDENAHASPEPLAASEEDEEEVAPSVVAGGEIVSRKGTEEFLSLSTPRETRKRTAAHFIQAAGSGPGSEQAAPLMHAEDEMDDAELADFLRQRRNRLISHTAARNTAQQQTTHAEEHTASSAAAGRGSRGRLRRIATSDQAEEDDRRDVLEQEDTADTELVPAATASAETVTKRRRVVLDDADEDDAMEMT